MGPVTEAPLLDLTPFTSLLAYCCAICARTLFGNFIISSEERELNGVGKLPFEVEDELMELPEFEPPRVDPDEDEETALLANEEPEAADAIGVEATLFCAGLESGSANVTGFCSGYCT